MTPPRPTQRIILLGASNLTRGLSIVIETARLLFATRDRPEQTSRGPLGVFAALGHGRAYGLPSRVLVRSLPSILDCGLWRAIENQQPDQQPPARVELLPPKYSDLAKTELSAEIKDGQENHVELQLE